MKTIPCPDCEGLGEYDTPHPLWGTRSCPEAYVRVICQTCEGSGKIEDDEEDEED